MLKANSLHHIQPRHSLASNPNLLSSQPTRIGFTLVHDQQGHAHRKYDLGLSEYNNEYLFFEWRKKIHHPIPRITQAKNFTDHNQRSFVSVFCEHINVSFADLRTLKVEQIIYSLSEMLLGYQQIYARLGFVCIEPHLMGLNGKGEILIWINQNLLAHFAEHRKIVTERQIVTIIVQILQSKAQDKSHLFFAQLRKLEPRFKLLLDFLMAFKTKHKLKIIPKIVCANNQSISEKMFQSNTFSSKTEMIQSISWNAESNRMMKSSKHIRPSHSQSQFLISSRAQSHQCPVVRNNHPKARTSIIQNSFNGTPNNMTASLQQKQSPKVNFSYSQKRMDLTTPKQSGIFRDYTSDRNFPLLGKIQSQNNPIKEFNLGGEKTSEIRQRSLKSEKSDRFITQTISVSYVPANSVTNQQDLRRSVTNQQDMRRSTSSQMSQASFKSQGKMFGQEVCQNKTSMTTNHRSNVTQSFQSMGKSSNDDENCSRRNDMFGSNNSHRVTCSVIKDSFIENQGAKNTVSIVLGNCHQYQRSSPLNNPFQNAQHMMNSSKQNQMYTFGGLIVPSLQSHVNEMKHSTTLPSLPHVQSSTSVSPAFAQKPTLANQINTKSIDQLYNNLYLNGENKSMIMEQSHYQVTLSPVKQEVHSSVKQESFAMSFEQMPEHQPLSHGKQNVEMFLKDYLTPKIGQGQEFDYNQWRGIKGLLNQSNVYELKESIHCGPEVRAHSNIKLELLDKFGRDIGKSILPSTPCYSKHSRTQSIYTIEEQPKEFC